mgnify:CR=1 FL=1
MKSIAEARLAFSSLESCGSASLGGGYLVVVGGGCGGGDDVAVVVSSSSSELSGNCVIFRSLYSF